MKRYVEREAVLRPAEEPGKEREVRGTADWKELREPLNEPQDQCLKYGHVVA